MATTTAADGSYYFFGVDPGTYKVDVTTTGGVLAGYTLTSGPQSSSDPTAGFTVSGNQVYDTADFGYFNNDLYSISDRTWYDANRNGLVDSGETGIANVTVDLVLDENGDGITNYEVIAGRIDLNNDGKVDTSDDNATGETLGGYKIIDGFVDINGDGSITAGDNGTYAGYRVIGGLIDLSGSGTVPINAGSIGDTVWLDNNGDGVKNGGEPGLSGVTVYLCTSSPCTSGNDSAMTTTDANGGYQFSGLAAGNYYVGVEATDVTNLTYTTFNGTTGLIALKTGEIYTIADFGYKPASNTAVIGDRIWSDADGDGVQDAGEAGIGGVTVQLKNAGGTVVDTVTTAPDGSYLFTGLAAGTYKVVITDTGSKLTGYSQTGDPDQTGACTVCDNNDTAVVVVANQVAVTSDFGYRDATNAYGVIGNTVFEDADGDGNQTSGEPGVAGVTVNLYTDPNGDGDPVDGQLVATVTTDVNGHYSFSGLPVSAGGVNYVVEVTDINNKLSGADQTADPDETGVCATCNDRGSVTLTTAAPTDDTVDFGYYTQDNGSISPEPIIATAISDADGNFTFDGLTNGDYVMVISDNTGQLTGFAGTTTDAQAGERGVTVAGSDVQGEHFGYAGLGPIGDTVFSDSNNNGVQDPGELGIANVEVKLYFDDGDGVFEPGTAGHPGWHTDHGQRRPLPLQRSGDGDLLGERGQHSECSERLHADHFGCGDEPAEQRRVQGDPESELAQLHGRRLWI